MKKSGGVRRKGSSIRDGEVVAVDGIRSFIGANVDMRSGQATEDGGACMEAGGGEVVELEAPAALGQCSAADAATADVEVEATETKSRSVGGARAEEGEGGRGNGGEGGGVG